MNKNVGIAGFVSAWSEGDLLADVRWRLQSFDAAHALRAARQLLDEAGIAVTAFSLIAWCDERIARPGFPAEKRDALVELRNAIIAAAPGTVVS